MNNDGVLSNETYFYVLRVVLKHIYNSFFNLETIGKGFWCFFLHSFKLLQRTYKQCTIYTVIINKLLPEYGILIDIYYLFFK